MRGAGREAWAPGGCLVPLLLLCQGPLQQPVFPRPKKHVSPSGPSGAPRGEHPRTSRARLALHPGSPRYQGAPAAIGAGPQCQGAGRAARSAPLASVSCLETTLEAPGPRGPSWGRRKRRLGSGVGGGGPAAEEEGASARAMLPPSGAASRDPGAGAQGSSPQPWGPPPLQRDSRTGFWTQDPCFPLQTPCIAINWQRDGVTRDN